MSFEFDELILRFYQKREAHAAELVRNVRATQDCSLITYVFEQQRAFDETGEDVDLVFEPVCIDELGWFGGFVRINGEIRLVTDFNLHFGVLDFSSYRVPKEIADLVEANIAELKPTAS